MKLIPALPCLVAISLSYALAGVLPCEIPNEGNLTSTPTTTLPEPKRFHEVRESVTLPPSLPAETAIVPAPTSLVEEPGAPFRFAPSTRILYDTRTAPRQIETTLAPMAGVLAQELELLTGILPSTAALATAGSPTANDIVVKFSTPEGEFAATEDLENQSYILASREEGMTITSAYSKGVSYGTASLIQSLREDKNGFNIAPMTITDTSDAPYRTVMLDLARQPHSIGVIQDTIRMARLFKIRYLQLHLTDDQNFTFPFPPVTGNITGNYSFTLAELNDLVDYADARGVTLIPEIDLPGHSSRLKQSGYLNPGATDSDVASPANYEKIQDLIDAALTVFDTSPYFHIGGDESGASEAHLVSFLAATNEHLRGTPPGGPRRMLVWEGFRQSAVSELPTTGDDRVIVLAWEGAYRAPWLLLQDGYQIVNASWKPMYVVGGGTRFHPGATSGKKWAPGDIHTWNKNTFMHWERGNAIFRDNGPSDSVKDDHSWDASSIGLEDLVIGGQLLFWEQRENSVIRQLIPRIAVMAERLWSPDMAADYPHHKARADLAMKRVLPIVQPVDILPGEPAGNGFISDIYYPYEGSDVAVTLVNRTRIQGTMRYETRKVTSPDLTSIEFFSPPAPSSSSPAYSAPVTQGGGFSIRAKLFRENGSPVGGDTWTNFLNYPNRVHVTEFDIGFDGRNTVPDLAAQPKADILRQFEAPMLRGTWRGVELVGQLHLADLVAPMTGEYTLAMKSSSGHASLYLDLNKNGKWEAAEKLISDTPSNESRVEATPVTLKAGVQYRLRVDHKSDTPRPVLVVYLNGPGISGVGEVSQFLTLPE
ncbi:family 20 glycosylhydrolase [Verrucomicrobiaceae bacterium 227]